MRTLLKSTGLTVAALVLGLLDHAGTARAQYIQVYSPPLSVVPAVSYYAPATSYYAPATSYYAPATSYYAPPVTSYYAPAATYSYYPPTTVYSAPAYSYYAPTTVYSAPAPSYSYYPAPVTTRSYVGYGIFRPRGVYTDSYYYPR